MKRLLIYLIILFHTQTWGQTPIALGYNDFIKQVVDQNPISKQAQNIRSYGELKLKSARGNYDPMINGSYDEKQFNQKNYFTTYGGEIKQPIFTNQYIQAGYDFGNGNVINPDLITPTNGIPYAGFEIGLLQGLIIDKRRAEVLKGKEYLNYYSAESKIQLNDLLFEASLNYFNVLLNQKQLQLTSFFTNLAEQRLQVMKELSNIGEKSPMDTIEAAIFYQSRLLELQTLAIDNQKVYGILYPYFGDSVVISKSILIPDSFDYYFENVNKYALNIKGKYLQNPILEKYSSYNKILNIDARLKKEMIKPNLNVKYNLLSNATTRVVPSTINNYKWGVNLSFPLLFRSPLNEYKMAKINAQNIEYELKNKSNELNAKLQAIEKVTLLLYDQIINAQRNVKYNKDLVEGEKIKFNNGESSLFIVNARESKWLESEIKLAEYKLKLIQTVFTHIHLTGTLNYAL